VEQEVEQVEEQVLLEQQILEMVVMVVQMEVILVV